MKLLKLLRLSPKDHGHAGFIVSVFKDSSAFSRKILEKKIDGTQHDAFRVIMPKGVEDRYVDEGVVIFRGYPWPYKPVLDEKVHKILDEAYPGSGLKRHRTSHLGKFEFIGKRNSNQSSGTLCARPGNTVNHQYFRQSMNVSLLPLARSIGNVLNDQAQRTAFTSGDSFLTAYLEEFNDQKWSIICAEIIITAAHFANTLHKDCSCLFDGESDNLKDLLSKDLQWKTYLRRFDSIFPDARLPKSTTCCWTMRENVENYPMLQFFCYPEVGICYDISSEETKGCVGAGATFHSSLSCHGSSAPVWIDPNGDIIVEPNEELKYSCNFAWGSSGGPSSRRRFYNANGGDQNIGALRQPTFLNWLNNQPEAVALAATNMGLHN